MSKPRYGLYYVPEEQDPLYQWASRFLGRNGYTGADMTSPILKGCEAERLHTITKSPRHYGFHATVKPPFTLSDGYDEDDLRLAVKRFAASRTSFMVPGLTVALLHGFIALRPLEASSDLNAFAAACVKSLDDFRAPPSDEETARRLKANLTMPQKAMLKTWGYPYVMDEYRFHMTLTERLEQEECSRLVRELTTHLEGILSETPWCFDHLTLVKQAHKDTPFRVLERIALGSHP